MFRFYHINKKNQKIFFCYFSTQNSSERLETVFLHTTRCTFGQGLNFWQRSPVISDRSLIIGTVFSGFFYLDIQLTVLNRWISQEARYIIYRRTHFSMYIPFPKIENLVRLCSVLLLLVTQSSFEIIF